MRQQRIARVRAAMATDGSSITVHVQLEEQKHEADDHETDGERQEAEVKGRRRAVRPGGRGCPTAPQGAPRQPAKRR